jgi:hypothetical protein
MAPVPREPHYFKSFLMSRFKESAAASSVLGYRRRADRLLRRYAKAIADLAVLSYDGMIVLCNEISPAECTS